MENRAKRDVKKGISGDDGRRKREEKSVAIRKDKKEEGLQKRRNFTPAQDSESAPETAVNGVVPTLNTPSIPTKAFTIADIPVLMKGIMAADYDTQFMCLRGFRKLLSSESNPPVQQCIDCGAMPHFVAFLQRHDQPTLQFEAAWVLTNIASTDRTRVVVEVGAIPLLIQLLTSAHADIREQSAWCLGNIAGDCAELRDSLLAMNALEPLVLNVAQPANISLLRNCTWALSNFCRGKPQPSLAVVAPALPVLANVLLQSNDQDAIIDATWALSYVSDGENARIQSVVDLNVIPALVNMLQSSKNQLCVPALRTLGNIVSGNDSQTQAVVNASAMNALVPLLQHSKKNIRKESCWLLSNIAAGSIEQLSQLLSVPDMLPRVLLQMSPSVEWDVRKEASWVISNIASGGNQQHVSFLVEHGCVQPVCELLDVGDTRLLVMAMETLEALLRVPVLTERVARQIDQAEGLDKLEQLQEHEDEAVYRKAVALLETYFGGEEEAESENLAPVSAINQSTFSFGLTSGKGAPASVFGISSAANQAFF